MIYSDLQNIGDTALTRLNSVVMIIRSLWVLHGLEKKTCSKIRAFSSNFGKRPLAKIGKKMSSLTAKLGEINAIEHNQGNKIYPQNQAILDCMMPTIPLKHKYLSIILIWDIVSQVAVVSKKRKKKIFLSIYNSNFGYFEIK